jgi:hypothetical protein
VPSVSLPFLANARADQYHMPVKLVLQHREIERPA